MKHYKLTMAVHWLFAAALVIFIAGCTSTSPENLQSKTTFSPADTKNYLDALADLKSGELDRATSELTKLSQIHPAHLGTAINLATA